MRRITCKHRRWSDCRTHELSKEIRRCRKHIPSYGHSAVTGLATALPGVFAAGALRSGYRGRLTNAVGEATIAALSAALHCRG